MTLQAKIKADLTTAMKQKDDARKNALRIIIGELSRSDKKEFEDDDIIKVIKKLIKSEKETLEKAGEADTSEYLSIMESYLPQPASDDEIKAWIQSNIDFDKYKNKMQAMGAIMKHFGSAADGNAVKNILQDL